MNPFARFDPDAGDYHPENALACAHAADTAYATDATIRARVRTWGFASSVFVWHEHLECFAANRGTMILLAFRGTENLDDWLTNKRAKKTNGPWGKVHRGFYRGARALLGFDRSDRLWSAVGQWGGHSKPVWLTGHSLGGALAVLSAMLLTERGVKPQGIYTFGQPRVGGIQFARGFQDELGDRTFRFVNRRDVVPTVPPAYLFYRHAGTLIRIRTDGSLVRGPSRVEPARRRAGHHRTAHRIPPNRASVPDHGMDRYIAALESNLDTWL